jgi:RNA polymerase sigma-70 factor, ECF subfamily
VIASVAATKLTDQDLIVSAQHGDRQAYGELVCRYRDGVVNVVYRLCGDPGLAEEAAQEAFIRAWQHLRSYKPQFSFRSWVYRIATNVALDVLRREPETTDVEAMPLRSASDGPEENLENRERIEKVRRAVLALPPVSRTVIVLREYEGLSYQEISTALDIPMGTVMSRLNYARKQLRQALADYLEVA